MELGHPECSCPLVQVALLVLLVLLVLVEVKNRPKNQARMDFLDLLGCLLVLILSDLSLLVLLLSDLSLLALPLFVSTLQMWHLVASPLLASPLLASPLLALPLLALPRGVLSVVQ